MCIINQISSAAWIAMVTKSLYLCTVSVFVTSDLQRRPAASPASCSRLFIASDQPHLLHSSVTDNQFDSIQLYCHCAEYKYRDDQMQLASNQKCKNKQ